MILFGGSCWINQFSSPFCETALVNSLLVRGGGGVLSALDKGKEVNGGKRRHTSKAPPESPRRRTNKAPPVSTCFSKNKIVLVREIVHIVFWGRIGEQLVDIIKRIDLCQQTMSEGRPLNQRPLFVDAWSPVGGVLGVSYSPSGARRNPNPNRQSKTPNQRLPGRAQEEKRLHSVSLQHLFAQSPAI